MATVLAGGAFDPLHPGHLAYLQAAGHYGAVCVAVATDAYIQTVKGRPALLSQAERMTLLLGLRGVKEVIAQDERGEAGALEDVRPQTYVKGADWIGRLPDAERTACVRLGIQPVFVDTKQASSGAYLASYVRSVHEQGLDRLEALIASQKPASAPWQPVTDYSFEARKAIEGPHPQLIKDVFGGMRILDVGCGPDAVLTRLLCALDVPAFGFDVCGLGDPSGWHADAPTGGRVWPGSITSEALVREIVRRQPCHELVIAREVLEHLTVREIRQAVTNLCRLTGRFVYVTTRHPAQPAHLFDVQTSDDLDPTHISMLPQTLLRALFVLEGFRRRADLEERLDHRRLGRVLIYERPQ